jgi:hypothetical protein
VPAMSANLIADFVALPISPFFLPETLHIFSSITLLDFFLSIAMNLYTKVLFHVFVFSGLLAEQKCRCKSVL